MVKIAFDDLVMQTYYEQLLSDGRHWKTARIKTITTFNEYDGVE